MTAVLRPFCPKMAMHPSVLEPGTHDEGKRWVVTVGLAPRNTENLWSVEFARPNGTMQSLAGCKGHRKGTKVLDHHVRSTGFEKPGLPLSMGTSSTGKRKEKGFREKI